MKLKLLIARSRAFTPLGAFLDGISKHPRTRGARTDAPLSGARAAGRRRSRLRLESEMSPEATPEITGQPASVFVHTSASVSARQRSVFILNPAALVEVCPCGEFHVFLAGPGSVPLPRRHLVEARRERVSGQAQPETRTCFSFYPLNSSKTTYVLSSW